MGLSRTPEPPYYAVIFSSLRTAGNTEEYALAAQRMLDLAAQQPGYLGVESARGADGIGITVSYWESLDAIRNWRDNAEHREIQHKGRTEWYAEFELRVGRIERVVSFPSAKSASQRDPGS